VLQAGGGHGLGNALYLDRGAGLVLKVYRSRRGRAGAWRELLRSIGHQLLEGKRGTAPRDRQRTEALVLRLWAAHGFDVPAVAERPTPPGLAEPCLWLEYCPGPTLDRALADPELPLERARALVARLAVDQARRHRKGIAIGEPLLFLEHPTIVHVLASGERLVTIDFENAWWRRFPVEEALARELAGTLRSIHRRIPERAEALFAAYVDVYPDRELLRRAAAQTLGGGGFAGALRRARDRRRENRPAKTEVMARVLARLA
jgi:hypothetical protein